MKQVDGGMRTLRFDPSATARENGGSAADAGPAGARAAGPSNPAVPAKMAGAAAAAPVAQAIVMMSGNNSRFR